MVFLECSKVRGGIGLNGLQVSWYVLSLSEQNSELSTVSNTQGMRPVTQVLIPRGGLVNQALQPQIQSQDIVDSKQSLATSSLINGYSGL